MNIIGNIISKSYSCFNYFVVEAGMGGGGDTGGGGGGDGNDNSHHGDDCDSSESYTFRINDTNKGEKH